MKHLKDITICVMGISLMGILAVIVIDEFMMASQHGGKLDPSIIELLQMSITGIVGIVAGWVSARSDK
tara:strand:+ start:3680 stop:3883 length:204 start_codon:yes stop_codon:yes gene_type:complete